MGVLIRTKQNGNTWFLSSGAIVTYMIILSWKQEAFDPCMKNIYVSSRGFTLVTVKKECVSLPHFIHLFLPVLQYPLKEQIHLRLFILSWYSGLKSFSICFCPAFCRWQHLSESQCRLLAGFVPSEVGHAHHRYNFTEIGGTTPWVNLTHRRKCFLKYHRALWAQWLCLWLTCLMWICWIMYSCHDYWRLLVCFKNVFILSFLVHKWFREDISNVSCQMAATDVGTWVI